MNHIIRTEQGLQAQVGARPAVADLKVIDHLDAWARRWLAASPLAFAAFCDERGVDATLAGGAAGFARADTPGRLSLPWRLIDDPDLAAPGRGAGLLFLIPGLGETLRINGVVAHATGDEILVDVHECYAHCAKALLRSDFWRTETAQAPQEGAGLDSHDFISAARFLGLATADARNRADLSPKGDPAGMLARPFDGGIRYADRPGNRRMDSLYNLLSRPRAAALLLAPGSTLVARAQGRTEITADPAVLAEFAVQGKTPRLAVSLYAPRIALRESAALARARLWDAPAPAPDIDPAAVFAAHVKLNRGGGWRAALARGMVSVPGLMRKGLEEDYKRNLY